MASEDKAKDLNSEGGFDYSIPTTPPRIQSPYFNPQHGFSPAYVDRIPLNTAPEYLDGLRQEKTRSFAEIVCYGSGFAYITGQLAGGGWGVYEGIKHREATTLRLRINTVLNSVTKRGPFLGNSMAVIAMMYSGLNAGIVKVRPDGGDDAFNQIGAGVVTGALINVSSGDIVRVARGSAVGLVLASMFVGGKMLWRSSFAK